MSVINVSNLLTNLDGNETFHSWSLSDANTGNHFDVQGQDNGYSFSPPGVPYAPLPSTFRELNSPSDGSHMFYISTNNRYSPPSNFTIHTQVKCYEQLRNGTNRLTTTTNHDFVWGDATEENYSPYLFLKSTFKKFSCLYLTEAAIEPR